MNELKEKLKSEQIELTLSSMSGGSTESCTSNISCFFVSSCSGSDLFDTGRFEQPIAHRFNNRYL
jgi:hypothetical protein